MRGPMPTYGDQCGAGAYLVNQRHRFPKARSDELHPSGTPANRMPSISAFAPGKERRIVAPCVGGITKAANGETRIERKSRLHRGPRLVQLPSRASAAARSKCAME